tara:strand:- start:1013 stop:1195 length:183 start_codon:yes stop_codon:yes gene_type:complete
MTEEQSADLPRWKIELFKFIGERSTWDNPTSLSYACDCGEMVVGKIIDENGMEMGKFMSC